MVEIVKTRLSAIGYEVVTAKDGDQAIEKAFTLLPNIIVIDKNMAPMDGIKACKILKGDPRTRRIPILIFTCEQTYDLEENCINAGAEGVIYKPQVSELVSAIKTLLSGKKLDDWE
jgi:CheY-like chemotaxis protein